MLPWGGNITKYYKIKFSLITKCHYCGHDSHNNTKLSDNVPSGTKKHLPHKINSIFPDWSDSFGAGGRLELISEFAMFDNQF